MNHDIHIEIFPTAKSCPQGCNHCHLAQRTNDISQSTIDASVQASYDALDAVLTRKKWKYTFDFAGPLDTSYAKLFPVIRNPKTISGLRFSPYTKVSGANLQNLGSVFAQEIQALIKLYGIHPSHIGFSIVPDSMIIGEMDAHIVQSIIENILPWHFDKEGGKTIRADIRSNLVDLGSLQNSYEIMKAIDPTYLLPVLSSFDNNPQKGLRKEEYTYGLIDANLHAYQSEFKYTTHDRNKVTITNRVIGRQKEQSMSKEMLKEQAMSNAIALKAMLDFAIAPQGVMINHTSAYINNPILWLSHADFQREITEQSKKRGFSLVEFSKNLIFENIAMFDTFYKKDKTLHVKDWIQGYEEVRPTIREAQKNK